MNRKIEAILEIIFWIYLFLVGEFISRELQPESRVAFGYLSIPGGVVFVIRVFVIAKVLRKKRNNSTGTKD